MGDDTLFNFLRRGQNVSDIFIQHRKKQGDEWSLHESLNRIYEEVAELSRTHRKNEVPSRQLEEASDIVLAVVAHLNRCGFTTNQIQNGLSNTLIKIEKRADELLKDGVPYNG